jgi:hypothetical protein
MFGESKSRGSLMMRKLLQSADAEENWQEVVLGEKLSRPDFRDIVLNSGHLMKLSRFSPDFQFSWGSLFLCRKFVKSVPILSVFWLPVLENC